MYKFLFIDCTMEPNGPGLPAIIEASDLVEACEKASSQIVPDRSLKVYQLPASEGLAKFIGLHIAGKQLIPAIADFWREQNPSKKVVQRKPRA